MIIVGHEYPRKEFKKPPNKLTKNPIAIATSNILFSNGAVSSFPKRKLFIKRLYFLRPFKV